MSFLHNQNRLEDTISIVLANLEFIDHHNEHEFVTVEDKLDNLEQKINQFGTSESIADVVKKVVVIILVCK